MEFGNNFKRARPPEDQRCLELHDSSGYFSAWTIMACQINPSVSYSLCYLYMYVIKVILLALIHILKVCIFQFSIYSAFIIIPSNFENKKLSLQVL